MQVCDAALPASVAQLRDGHGRHAVSKSRGHGRLLSSLSSLVQLVKDPARTMGFPVADAAQGLGGPRDAASGPYGERTQVLYLRMKNATSYEDWRAAATALDMLEGNDDWKLDDESVEYNAELVAIRLQQLDDARLSCDVAKMMFLVRTSLTRGLGGMGHLRLYKHSHIGTKQLIERYIESAQKTLDTLRQVSAKQGANCPIEPRLLVEQLLLTRQSFGRSALLLSGGGTFGMNHIGVVKTLWHSHLLPRIISGSSAGSIVCAVLCSRTDAEIPTILEEFCYGDLAVFEKENEEEGLMKKVTRFLKYGALFDISNLMGVMRTLLGDMTFQESYNRTRRILNITVSSKSLYELPRLLNYVTAPNVMIWSAVCASCSVPFVFSPASLLAKDPRTGQEVPWNQTSDPTWIDGSVDNDLPMTRLAEMFNVNHFIVSQVNPHVVPFLTREEEMVAAEAQQNNGPVKPSWIHNAASLAKGEALHRLQILSEMGIFPNYLTKARSVLNQRYSGDITIFPTISYTQFPKILKNPTTEYMLNAMITGERATWPKLSRIQNHLAIEIALDETIRQIRARVVFSPSQVHKRNNNPSRPISQGSDRSKQLPQKHNGPRRDITIPTFTSTNPKLTSSRRTNHPLVRLPSSHLAHPSPFLANQSRPLAHNEAHPSIIQSSSSSTNPGASESSDDDIESDTSHMVSPPSASGGHPPSSFWPSKTQLFPSASNPSTPSIPIFRSHSHSHSRRDLTMTSDTPLQYTAPSSNTSSTNLHHNRLFHPPPPPKVPAWDTSTALQPTIQRAVEDSIQPKRQGGITLHQTESDPELQKVPPVAVLPTEQHPQGIAGAEVTSKPLAPSVSELKGLEQTETTNVSAFCVIPGISGRNMPSLERVESRADVAAKEVGVDLAMDVDLGDI